MASVLDIIKHYQKDIEKHSDDEAKVLRCINKLFQLKVTVQHLQDTGVGRTVNALRKEPGDVGQAARALVLKWKTMVAAEESDQEGDHRNDTSTQNGHGSGRESDDHSRNSQDRHSSSKHSTPRSNHNESRSNYQEPRSNYQEPRSNYEEPRSNHQEHWSNKEEPRSNHQEQHRKENGHHSGSKRKYHSSEEEDHDTKKKSRHTSSSEDDHKKPVVVKQEKLSDSESSGDESESSDSESDSYTSESSREDVKVKTEIKQEIKKEKESPDIQRPSQSSRHSSHEDRKQESSSSKRHDSSDKDRSSHNSSKEQSRHSAESSKSSSHKLKSSHEKENSSDKRQKSDTSSDERKESKSSKHSSEKHKSSSQKHSSSDRHKSSEKHSSKESKSSSHTEKAPEKHKSSSENDKHKLKESSSSKDKRSSSSKDVSKERHSSSKERSSHSEKKLSSSEKSHSDKAKHKSDDRSSETKSKEKSSSSHKSKSSSSSKSREEVPKKKSKLSGEESGEDGIDCGSGASFAEALGMMVSPSKPKKKTYKDINSPNSLGNNDFRPAALLAPSAKLAPLPPIEISALPEISPNYKPRPPPKAAPHFSDEDAISAGISSKNQRTKVYSGNKVIGKIPSLYEMCVHVLQEHIDALEFTGGVPYDILKPVIDRATPQQLFTLEHYNPYLMEDTDHLWQRFCEKSFRNKRRLELETWREMYMRCQEEQESKLRSLTANIRMTQEAKKAPIKQTKMAYVDSVVKPPRNVARKQALHGTAHAASASPAARVASLSATAGVLKPGRPAPAPSLSASSFKPKKAPLMQKALQFMRGRKR